MLDPVRCRAARIFVVMTTYPAHYESVTWAEPKMGDAWAM